MRAVRRALAAGMAALGTWAVVILARTTPNPVWQWFTVHRH